MVKWAAGFSEFKIQFAPKMEIKAHAITDFTVDGAGNIYYQQNGSTYHGYD